jgi:hypothetical protein
LSKQNQHRDESDSEVLPHQHPSENKLLILLCAGLCSETTIGIGA